MDGPTPTSIAPMLSVRQGARAVVARLAADGAAVVHHVANEYGWRLGRAADPFGHHWEIGKPLPPGA